MNKLRIPLSAIAAREGFTFEKRLSEADLRPQRAPRSSLREVVIAGKVTAVDSEYLLNATLSGTFERPCDRCLEPARCEIGLEVVWFFEPGVQTRPPEGLVEYDEDDAFEEDVSGQRVHFFEGDEIDLGPHVWEEMVLAAPTKFYCMDECKGLCPRCGLNLNQGACSCASEQEAENSGLAGLKEMFPELQSESSEE